MQKKFNFRPYLITVCMTTVLWSSEILSQCVATESDSAAADKPSVHVRKEAVPEIASGDPAEPAIHGPRIIGCGPGHPFFYKVPFTGEGNVTISAEGLPSGLSINARGFISGSIKSPGEYRIKLKAKNALGESSRNLKLAVGDHKLALTPPMGWNSWNVWAGDVDAAKVKAAAEAMIASGLAAKGFQYINIDDTWEGDKRSPDGEITSNKKFGDMKALAKFVHSKGLRLGIYSSPGPKTCAGYLGSYQHEDQDAKTYADWQIDYLKYDWCSYGDIDKGNSLESFQKPYSVMHHALDRVDRDIVYSLCQYGMGDVWTWGGSAQIGGNCWRSSGDIADNWSSMSRNGFALDKISKYASPGHWNDPDMLIVGKLGWGASIHNTKLTPNEQLSHITLWCMVASPLLIGCDMTQMDKFTRDLLSNTELIDIDQDPLGKAAVCVSREGDTEVWARPLFDGTYAVALFNRAAEEAKVETSWKCLRESFPQAANLKGKQPLRNLWTRKALAESDGYSSVIPRHGAVLLKVGAPHAEQ